MVAGLFDSSMWEMASVGYIWGFRGHAKEEEAPKTRQRKRKRWTDETGKEQRERESSINEQVQGRGGEVELRED